MTRLDQLYQLRARVDAQIAAEVDRLEVAAADARARQRRAKRNRAPVAECGTDSGYYRHRRTLGEDACDECKHAHTKAETLRLKRRRVSREERKKGLRLVQGEGA